MDVPDLANVPLVQAGYIQLLLTTIQTPALAPSKVRRRKIAETKMNAEHGEKSTNVYERWRTFATVFGAVLVPVVVAVVGQSYTAAIKEQESRARFVELAIEILREDPSQGEEDPLRQWAADVVNANSGTQLSPLARTVLVKSRALPSGGRASVDPIFNELSVSTTGGEVSILAMSNCADRSDLLAMQVLVYDSEGNWDHEQHPVSEEPWNKNPVLRFDPAKIHGQRIQLDATVKGTKPCTMVLVMKQGGETLRTEHVDLVADENFFSMPIRIERSR